LPLWKTQGIVVTNAMITTCPACTTVFRVNDEQLAAREGKVRCGQCLAVFDARTALESEPADPTLQSGSAGPDSPPKDETLAFPEIEKVPGTLPVASRNPDASRQHTGAPRTQQSPKVPPVEPIPSTWSANRTLRGTRRTPYRTAWAILGLLLAMILIAQISFHYRGELAWMLPSTRPLFQALCARLDCRVPLPRRAQLVSIESSDLQADPANPSVMVLTASLRNRATFAQAYPSLELTLTDPRDQPLARRVLGAADYLGANTNREAAFAANSEIPVKVYIDASSLRATGYRLYLFYP